MKLYEIADEFESVFKALEFDGELTEEIERELARVEVLLIEKTDSCLFVAQKYSDEIDLAKTHIDRLKNYIKVRESAMSRYEEYIKSTMDKMGKDKIDGILGRISIRKPTPVVDIFDQDILPPEFKTVVQEVKVDKKAIKDSINSGESVMGARLINGKRSVQFKLKGAK